YRKGIEGIDIAQIFKIEAGARIVPESLGMGVDFAQLRTPDAGEGLAGRAANDHVDRIVHRAPAKLGSQLLGMRRDDIAGLAELLVPAMKVESVRTRGVGIEFDCRAHREAGPVEAEGQAPAA